MKDLITISLHLKFAKLPNEKSSLVREKVKHWLSDSMISHTSKKWLSIQITFIFSTNISLLPLSYKTWIDSNSEYI